MLSASDRPVPGAVTAEVGASGFALLTGGAHADDRKRLMGASAAAFLFIALPEMKGIRRFPENPQVSEVLRKLGGPSAGPSPPGGGTADPISGRRPPSPPREGMAWISLRTV